MKNKIIRIGTRKSKLALIQTKLVKEKIRSYYPDLECQIVPIITSGDLIKNINLYEIGGKALFVKELEQALSMNQIDMAVHSLKDVPAKIPEHLTIAAMLEREKENDAFICKNYSSIAELPQSAVIGTSSVRRKVLISRERPDLNIVTFRGNVDTRLKKLMNDEVDATILAYSGLKRLNLFDPSYCHIINISDMLPCVGQGTIAIEIRKEDRDAKRICEQINHIPTWELSIAPRAFLEYLEADCNTPIAAYSEYIDYKFYAKFMLSDISGKNILFHEEIFNKSEARASGIKSAKILSKALKQYNAD